MFTTILYFLINLTSHTQESDFSYFHSCLINFLTAFIKCFLLSIYLFEINDYTPSYKYYTFVFFIKSNVYLNK